ncbi:TPA: hypothetical protein N0F65_004017 [Lagenidium giganteum]|uniref:Uncharacterized protein n=1 Tax=Lagenidium giganteum TaxID=4803 RepID=A0AAV2YVC8_9STRA|nr:TPA: hypothetical protein N0F65_004017 [Lagenidium giganteum]
MMTHAILDKDQATANPEHDASQLAQIMPETINIFEGGKQTKYYHGMFNHNYFVAWMTKLLTGLQARNLRTCRIVIDTAKYHKVLPASVPKKRNAKAVLMDACERYPFSYSQQDTKDIVWEKLASYVA